jgi:large subunit ribosomal protein L4
MPNAILYNTQGSAVGQIDLSDDVFGVEVNEAVLHQVVKMQLANKRQGTQSTLTRAEVRGGGKKPWRQKGTGRARHGSIRSPIWRKGGVIFAPKPREYRFTIPKKIRRLAMKCALSSKLRDEQLMILDALNLPAPKTREMAGVLKNLSVNGKALLVLAGGDESVERACRNIPGIKLAFTNTLNVLDILNYEKFIATEEAVRRIEEVYA